VDVCSGLPPLLRASLLPFQEQGVAFAIKHGGRVMIGDEMGLGSRPTPLLAISIALSGLIYAHVMLLISLVSQKLCKPFRCAGCCAIAGQRSSSCQRACVQRGLMN
jgi:hypothetical protein